MRHLLLVLGALAAVALTVVGVTTTVDAAGSFSDVRIGDTRTAMPGSREVELDEGKYVVFYEVSDEGVSGDSDNINVPPLDVRVREAGDGRALDLDDYTTDFDVSSGGRAAQAIATVEVPEDGRYEITATDSADAPSPAVVLGKPITRRILRLVVGIAGSVAGLALLGLVGALAIGFAVRGRKAAE